MKIAVDTHAMLWYLQGSTRLSRRARATIDDGVQLGGVVVSMGVVFDLVYLTEKGKLPVAAMQQVRHVIDDPVQPFTLAPVTSSVMDSFIAPAPTRLPDPWDRLIVATAVSEGLSLVTRDELITESRLVQTIW